MNKEQQELLDEAYENYENEVRYLGAWVINDVKDYDEIYDEESGDGWEIITPFTQEEFINKCKTDTEFSEKWGLKIEERELTYSERYKIWFTNNFETGMEYCEDVKPDFNNEYYEPTSTKLITVTYNDKTIESYV